MEQTFCQSCGMPLAESVLGTNPDGSANADYCHYCYKEGRFAQDCTMDEMIAHCVQFLEEFNKDAGTEFTKEQAVTQMRQFFPQLKRWKK